ncbi:ATP-binding protein [Lipingzhangella sp. LS1_29]|uniref:ATP-binding protein n=1 Tax=Lipingzhangella rawalii TaxID=2055835 RepID=A0ABU2H457_9ACTN|nr:ATP-binding protein [Lipingzhangella rawalii]MDS1270076.1 ATP-binding protein [Lipingzhangella rawalii]
MDERFSIELPRKACTVAVVRDFLGAALDASGVDTESRNDILAAVSEACGNVVEHGDGASGYLVCARIQWEFCDIEISNSGRAFDIGRPTPPPIEAESGRGILLMHGLVDQVGFRTAGNGGTRVYLHKRFPSQPRPPRQHSSRERPASAPDSSGTCPLGAPGSGSIFPMVSG